MTSGSPGTKPSTGTWQSGSGSGTSGSNKGSSGGKGYGGLLIKEQVTRDQHTQVFLTCGNKSISITAVSDPIYRQDEDDSLIYYHTSDPSDLAIAAAQSDLGQSGGGPVPSGCWAYFGPKSAIYRVMDYDSGEHVGYISSAMGRYNARINKPVEIAQSQVHIAHSKSYTFVATGYVKASFHTFTTNYSGGSATYHGFRSEKGGQLMGRMGAQMISANMSHSETISFILQGGGASTTASISSSTTVTNTYTEIQILTSSKKDTNLYNPFSLVGQYLFVGPGGASSMLVFDWGGSSSTHSEESEYHYDTESVGTGVTAYALTEVTRSSKSDCYKVNIPEEALSGQEAQEAKDVGLGGGSTIEIPISALPSSSIPSLEKLLGSALGIGMASGSSTSCPSGGMLVQGRSILPVSTYIRTANIIQCKSMTPGGGSTNSGSTIEVSFSGGHGQTFQSSPSHSVSSRSVVDGAGVIYRDISVTPSSSPGGPGVQIPVQPKSHSSQIVKQGASKARITLSLSNCYFLSSSSLQSFADALIAKFEADGITYSGVGPASMPSLTRLTSATFDHLGPSWSISGFRY